MSDKGDKLSNFNQQLIKCLEDLREKKSSLNREIKNYQEDKIKTENELNMLNNKLKNLNEILNTKTSIKNNYDKAIKDTENAYAAILSSSQNLLHVVKQESVILNKNDFNKD